MKSAVEIERKFVIVMPSIDELSRQSDYTVSRITQTYLESDGSVTHRVRKREWEDRTVFTETEKKRIDKMSANETESEIGETEYLKLLGNKKAGTSTVIKTRHTFTYLDKTVEIDIYPQWKESCVMEIELESREEKIALPSFIKIVKEVTGDRTYSNAAMAECFPQEIFP